MNNKLWGSSFRRKLNPVVEHFTASLSFDRVLASYDIDGSIAHVKMLSHCELIDKKDKRVMIRGLKKVADEIKRGEFKFKVEDEDIHSAIEKALRRKVGAVADKLHTARSRNDQVSLDMRLFLRGCLSKIVELVKNMQKCIVAIAEKNLSVLMPGFTHMQHAQPVLFSHHIMTYFYMLERDRDRLKECLGRVNCLPLGACALAGTSLPVDRKFLAKILGFRNICEHSIDAVSDRDFVLEFLSIGAILMMHLSRLSEEIIIWASREFDFVKIDENVLTGSSIMPHKKNPDVVELIRGKCGRVYGNLINVFTVMKALPLSYNRDLQEDKEPLFDTVFTLMDVLRVYPVFLKAIRLNPSVMKSEAGGGFMQSTDMVEYLVKRGVPFRKAYSKVGKLIAECLEKKKDFRDLRDEDLLRLGISPVDREKFSPEGSVRGKKSLGSTSPTEVRRLIKKAKQSL